MPCFPNFWRRLRSLFGVGNREGSRGEEIGELLSPGLRRCLTVLADPPQILVDFAIVWILHLYAAELEEETDGAIGWTQESLESVPPVLLTLRRPKQHRAQAPDVPDLAQTVKPWSDLFKIFTDVFVRA